MAFTEILNLEKIFVNYFAGSWTIFFFIAMAGLAYMAAKFRMPNLVTIIVAGLFIIFMANYYSLLYILLIMTAGLVMYYIIARTFKS